MRLVRLSARELLSERRRLPLAVFLSLLLHTLLLGIHFGLPEGSRVLREPTLEVILVNSRSATRPTQAQALAQANLDGGGNVDDDRRVKTPLPPTDRQSSGDQLLQMQRRVQEMEAMQQALLTQARSQAKVASAPTRSTQPTQKADRQRGLDLADSARAMARLEGEIAKGQEEYNSRPRKKFVGARAQEYALAAYLESWRNKVERVGTLNYPEAARGKLYGNVVIYVELNAADGSIYNVEISRSSGHAVLDQAALRILKLAAPFGPIPAQGLGGASVLSFARTWQFTQGDAFSSSNK